MSSTELARIALAVIWSIACIFTYAGTGSVPGWMLGFTTTSVGWFFVSTENDKRNARRKRRGKRPRMESPWAKIKDIYFWFWHDIMKREEPYTDTIRRWVKAHPIWFRLIVSGSIGGFVAWLTFILHLLELW